MCDRIELCTFSVADIVGLEFPRINILVDYIINNNIRLGRNR